jgi:hypothetical protein
LILAAPATPPADADVETRLKVYVKNPEIILLEDQHNANSNCLVLDVSLFQISFIDYCNQKNLLVSFGRTNSHY